jgi:hypothetical protein
MATRAVGGAEVVLEVDEGRTRKVSLVERATARLGRPEDPAHIGDPKAWVVDRREELGGLDERARPVGHPPHATIGDMTEPTDRDEGPGAGETPTAKPTLGSRMAAAVGTAMLGLEQAMHREPPAEVVVREHQPERDLSSRDGDFTVGFPDEPR